MMVQNMMVSSDEHDGEREDKDNLCSVHIINISRLDHSYLFLPHIAQPV